MLKLYFVLSQMHVSNYMGGEKFNPYLTPCKNELKMEHRPRRKHEEILVTLDLAKIS